MPREEILRIPMALIALLATAFAAEPDGSAFANRVYAVTKARDYPAYTQLMDSRCHVHPFTERSFDLRGDLLNKLAPGAPVEAMPFADYREMMQKRGAPPDRIVYTVQPSHIVIVRGTVPGVVGGDHVALNPIVKTGGEWKLLDGDCLAPR